MKLSWRGLVFWAAIALVAAGSLHYVFSAPPIPVDTIEVVLAPFEVTVNEEGVSRIREIYKVSAPINGRILRAPREVGDTVTKNATLVATIEPSAPSFLDERSRRIARARVKATEAALKLARANVMRAEAELTFARADYGRAEKLFKRGTISDRTLDQAKLNVDTRTAALDNAHADVEVKTQEVGSARAQLIEPGSLGETRSAQCCVQVLAPESGRVLKIMAESEQVVSAGTPILEIGDPRDLEVVVDLLSSDAVRVVDGNRAYIERWGGHGSLGARVRRIEPSGFKKVSALGIEEQRVKVRLDLDGPPGQWSRLGHDYRVFVRIVTWQADNALQIPLSALFRKGNDWAVFKAVGDTAELQYIELGRRNLEHAQILRGLEVGERIILHPSDRIQSGTKIIERSDLE